MPAGAFSPPKIVNLSSWLRALGSELLAPPAAGGRPVYIYIYIYINEYIYIYICLYIYIYI